MTTLYAVLSLIVFAALILLLAYLKKKGVAFTLRILTGLGLGLVYGAGLQLIFGKGGDAAVQAASWFGIVGSGFTKALQLLIVPLVLVSIIHALTRIGQGGKAAKTSLRIIGILLATTAISALVGFLAVHVFRLDASALVSGITQPADRTPTDIPTSVLNIIPNNLFSVLTANAALPVVFVAVLLGFAIRTIKSENPALGEKLAGIVDGANELVMTITDFIIRLTPYGVLALIARVTSVSDFAAVLSLLSFVLASFAALIAVFLIHLLILALFKVNPALYLKKAFPTLLFAFTSRSSSATLPMTIQTLHGKLGASEAHANLAGSFGTTIGQNGCAGVHPAIVATLVAAALGWNVWSLGFIVPLVLYIVITSIGIAGVGGGATNASILVLSLFGLPIELVAILASVEFIIDMGRTALNVNDAIVAGLVAARIDGELDDQVLNAPVSA